MTKEKRNEYIETLVKSAFHSLYWQGLDQDEIEQKLEEYRGYLNDKNDIYLQNMTMINC